MARGYLLGQLPGLGSRRSLAARGQILNTFAGPGFCVALSLLAVGGYLIELQSENPLEDQSVRLLFAAVLIGTGASLLYCLLHTSRRFRRRAPIWPATWPEKTITVVRGNAGLRVVHNGELPLHNRFVDRTVVRIRR